MKVLPVLVLLAMVAFVACERTREENKAFVDFCKKFNKRYDTHEEREKAFDNFLKNKEKIDVHNKDYKEGKVKFHLAIWEHADLSPEDVKKRITGAGEISEADRPKRQVAPPPTPGPYPTYPAAPDAIDWRDEGLVGPVEKQAIMTTVNCNSCYTFSTAVVVNAMLRKKKITDELVSNQQLINCAKNNLGGCQGGWQDISLEYIKDNGLTSESVIPYVDHEQPCNYDKSTAITPPNLITKVWSIPTRNNETWMKEIVGNVGPVSISICPDDFSFQLYRGGYYDNPDCCKDLNHAVNIVGYGTDPTDGDYWIIKNSWGTSWGENGYMKLARNKGSQCSVAYLAFYAE